MEQINREELIKLVETINKEGGFSIRTIFNLAEMFDIRICGKCGKLMYEGYCIEGGVIYYCSDECMQLDGMSKEEFEELFDNGNGDTYWTEWI